MDFALGGDASVIGGVRVKREGHDVLRHVAWRRATNVVMQETGVAARGGFEPTFLIGCALQQHVEIPPRRRDSQSFKALVIGATCYRVFGDDRDVRTVRCGQWWLSTHTVGSLTRSVAANWR